MRRGAAVELGKNVKGLIVGDPFLSTDKAMRDPARVSATSGFSNYLRIPQCEVGYNLLPADKDLLLRATVLIEPSVITPRRVKAQLFSARGSSASPAPSCSIGTAAKK